MSQGIVIATLMRPEGETGVQTHFRQFMVYLRDAGYQVALVTPFSSSSWLIVPVFGLRKFLNPFCKSFSVWWYRYWHQRVLTTVLRRQLADNTACVIYAQCPLSAAAALKVRASPKQRVVMIVHFNVSQADEWVGKDMLRAGGRVWKKVRRLESDVLPRLDGLVFSSRYMRDELLARIPDIAAVQQTVVPSFISDPGEPSGVDRVYDLITVGTLEPRKNHSYMLDILAAARAKGHLYTLTVVGDGSEYLPLVIKAQELELRECVRFSRFVPHAVHLMPQHRAYIHAALMDNMPHALVEALACGLPVLAAPVGGIPEIFSDGVEGHYLPLDAPQEAAGKLSEVLDKPEVCAAMASAGRRRFCENYDMRVVGRQLYDFLANDQVV